MGNTEFTAFLNYLPVTALFAVFTVVTYIIFPSFSAQLAMACDFRLMSSDAEIQFLQVKMGLTPGGGGGARLVNQVGKQTALRLLGKAEKVNLSYGRQIGLVDGELTNDKVSFELHSTLYD
mgnify:CR=1 FL=1